MTHKHKNAIKGFYICLNTIITRGVPTEEQVKIQREIMKFFPSVTVFGSIYFKAGKLQKYKGEWLITIDSPNRSEYDN